MAGPIINTNHITEIGIDLLAGTITPLEVRNPADPDFSLSLLFDPVLEGDDTISGGAGDDQIFVDINQRNLDQE